MFDRLCVHAQLGDEQEDNEPAPYTIPASRSSEFDNVPATDEEQQPLLGLAEIPLFPLSVVLFPGAILPLNIFEERYKLMFSKILDGNKLFGVVLYSEENGRGKIASIGCCGEVLQHERLPDERYITINRGMKRFKILNIVQEKPYLQAVVQWIHDSAPDKTEDEGVDVEVLRKDVEGLLRDVLHLSGKISGKPSQRSLAILDTWKERTSESVEKSPVDTSRIYEEFSFAVSGALEMPLREQQALLEMLSTPQRLKRQAHILKSTRDYLAAHAALNDLFPST